jgi:hypothetical protein
MAWTTLLLCIPAAAIIALAALAAAALVIGRRNKMEGFDDALKALAADIGCDYVPAGRMKSPKIEGTHRGCRILIDRLGSPAEEGAKTYTRMQVWHNGLLADDILLRPTKGKKPDTSFKTGDPRFDAEYEVLTKDTLHAKGMLDSEVREKLIMISVPLTVKKDAVYFEAKGSIDEPEKLKDILDTMVDMAKLL